MSIAELPEFSPGPVPSGDDVSSHPRPYPRPGGHRPRASGKFLAVGPDRLWVRGVTYGTFAPDADGQRFPAPQVVKADFQAMVVQGIQRCARLHAAAAVAAGRGRGSRAVGDGRPGLGASHRVSARPPPPPRGRQTGRGAGGVGRLPSGHPGLRGGQRDPRLDRPLARPPEGRAIPGSAVPGRHRADPQALVTYVNFPSSEYLAVPAADLVCFNVYLEEADRLAAYVARLHSLAGERPLVLAELGLDSARNELERQAEHVADQIATAFTGGSRARSCSRGPTSGTGARGGHRLGLRSDRPRAQSQARPARGGARVRDRPAWRRCRHPW